MTDALSPARSREAEFGGVVLRLPGPLREQLDQAIGRAVEERWAARLWDRDTTLWTSDPQVARRIEGRLGWLDAPSTFAERATELEAFAEAVRAAGFTRALVCGMGGSSLAPEVLARSFPRSEHGLGLDILDSTDPEAVRAATERSDPATTLYLIATKSGTTTETLAFLAHLWELQDELHGSIPDSVPGDHFIAITDAGRPLEAIPHSDAFRSVFLNPADVGGRYSALTYVGLVPAALLGLDMASLLGDAQQMAQRCRALDASNPALALGASLAALARSGRDKLTLVIEPELAAVGSWLEQLIAESTGKHGTGIVPVDGESLGPPSAYGQDRVFVRLGRRSVSDWLATTDDALDALVDAGHPVIELALEGGEWLGGEFFRWEFATALAGAGLGIDPFDEPNVTESKDNTRRVLDRYHEAGDVFPEEPVLAESGHLRFVGDAALRLTDRQDDLVAELRRHLARIPPSGYLSLHAYLAPTPARDEALAHIQRSLRDATGRAVTRGYGPRFLHSTGQLHKGGTPSGAFIQLVAGHPADLPIPGRDETFGVLIDAQARGDLASLEAHDLPALCISLGDEPDVALAEFQTVLEQALG